jgi:hypothetical protein
VKKLIATFGLSAMETAAFAQGLVIANNNNSTPFQTNLIAFGGSSGDTVGGSANVGTFD